MEDVVLTIFEFRQEASGFASELAGRDVPLEFILAPPFLVPFFLAGHARRPLTAAAILAMGWIAAMVFASAEVSMRETFVYFGLLCASMAAATDASIARRRIIRVKRKNEHLASRLRIADHELEKERFWRRAGGDGRPCIPDEEIVRLAERATEMDVSYPGASGQSHDAA